MEKRRKEKYAKKYPNQAAMSIFFFDIDDENVIILHL